jgi:hypothetical protein
MINETFQEGSVNKEKASNGGMENNSTTTKLTKNRGRKKACGKASDIRGSLAGMRAPSAEKQNKKAKHPARFCPFIRELFPHMHFLVTLETLGIRSWCYSPPRAAVTC